MAKIKNSTGRFRRAGPLLEELGLADAVSTATFMNWVREGRAPRPLVISGKIKLWDIDEARKWLAEKEAATHAAA